MVSRPKGGHGGADPRVVAEFLRFVREGGATNTSPLDARFAVAAGCAATDSIRSNGQPQDVSDVSQQWQTYFNRDFQEREKSEVSANGSANGRYEMAK